MNEYSCYNTSSTYDSPAGAGKGNGYHEPHAHRRSQFIKVKEVGSGRTAAFVKFTFLNNIEIRVNFFDTGEYLFFRKGLNDFEHASYLGLHTSHQEEAVISQDIFLSFEYSAQTGAAQVFQVNQVQHQYTCVGIKKWSNMLLEFKIGVCIQTALGCDDIPAFWTLG